MTIEGGTPQGNKIIVLSEEDMKEVERFKSLGSKLNERDIADHNRRSGVRRGRQTRAAAYQDYMDRLKYGMDSGASGLEKAELGLARLNSVRNKDIAPLTVHNNATLSNISLMYANEDYIGEALCPAIMVNKQSDIYFTYGQRDRLQYPDDELGHRGEANEIQETRSTATYAAVPYGYQNFVSAMTLANQDAPLNEMVDLVEAINEGMAFRRELRLATLLTTSGNYGSNTAAVAAAKRWDTLVGGNPVKDLQNAQKALWSGRGPGEVLAFCSLDVFLVLSRHPAILDLFKYNGSSPGLATPDMIAKWFDMSRLLVGKARKDTAKEGQTAVFSRVWANSFGMVRVQRRPSVRNASFALTFQHGAPISTQWFDPRSGHGGGFYAKVSVSEHSKIFASDTGYLLTTPIG